MVTGCREAESDLDLRLPTNAPESAANEAHVLGSERLRTPLRRGLAASPERLCWSGCAFMDFFAFE